MRKHFRAPIAALLALSLFLTAGCGASREPETPEPAPEEAPTHAHSWQNGVCTSCGKVCEHRWDAGKCRICGTVCLHRMEDGVCEICGFGCPHAAHDAQTEICSRCGQKADHSYLNGVCTRCGEKPFFFTELKELPYALTVPASSHGTTETFHYPLHVGEVVPGAHATELPEDRRMRDLIVYLPAGYDPEAQYDVVIVVPGAGHNVHSWMEWPHHLSTPVGRLTGPELMDRLIESGLIPPMILVAAEYYQSGTAEEIAVPFEDDLRGRVLPFLAANYATYASVDENGVFHPAPEHFAYVAASFGAMVGWQMIPTATDLFSYWALLSGAFQNDEQLTERINEGVSAEHPIHWLYAGDGQLASGWRPYMHRIEHLNENCACLQTDGNLCFLTLDKGGHSYPTWDVGLINSLQVFFRSRYDPAQAGAPA